MSETLLSQVRSLCVIDVDSMDPDVAAKHSSTGRFCDMTSNQAIVYFQAIRPERSNLIKTAMNFVRNQGSSENFEMDVIDVLTVLLGKEVYPHLSGSVHAQTTPSAAYDTEKTIHHAKKLVELFGVHGIPTHRVCIKIPATPESMVACKYLATIGIRTLATALFSVPQAVTASQAGCTYVAPYFNELRVHFEPDTWKDYENPGQEHPMSSVIREIVLVFKDIQSTTLVMPASIVTAKEVIGLVSVGPNHLTLSASVLEQLANMPAVDPTLFYSPVMVQSERYKGKDFLKDQCALLKDALGDDAEASRKLADALKLFDDCEQKTKAFIQSFQP